MKTKALVSELFFNKTKIMILYTLNSIGLVVFGIAGVVLIGKLIDNVIVPSDQSYLSLLLTLLAIDAVMLVGMMFLKEKQVSNITSNVATGIAKNAHEALLKAELSDVEKEGISELAENIFENSMAISERYVKKNMLTLIDKSIYILTLFLTLIFVKPILCVILFASLPFFYLITRSLTKHCQKASQKVQDNKDKVNKAIKNMSKNVRNVKLMNGIDYEIDDFEALTSEFTAAKENSDMLNFISETAVEKIITLLVTLICTGVCAWLAIDPFFGMDAGTLFIFVSLIPVTFLTFTSLMKVEIGFGSVEKEAEELDKILSLHSEMKSEPVNIIEEIHSLKFIDVTYSKHPKTNVIEGISFELKRGEKLGIIADDDAKDAIFDVLTKLSKPKQGYVSINNCDINKINTSYLRELITSIFDSSTIYDDTIMNNIAYPATFDDYKYNDALNKSGLKDIIATLPDRDNTIVSDDSELITQDIKNRMVFANAFYKDSKIFVLNEATKDFDINTEAEILNEIFKLKSKIIVMLTDKVYNLSRCDKILIIQEGKITEYGKYDDLLHDKNSYFYKLIKKGSLSKRQNIS